MMRLSSQLMHLLLALVQFWYKKSQWKVQTSCIHLNITNINRTEICANRKGGAGFYLGVQVNVSCTTWLNCHFTFGFLIECSFIVFEWCASWCTAPLFDRPYAACGMPYKRDLQPEMILSMMCLMEKTIGSSQVNSFHTTIQPTSHSWWTPIVLPFFTHPPRLCGPYG